MLVSGTADQEVRLGRAVQPVAAEKISGTRLRRPSSPRPEMASSTVPQGDERRVPASSRHGRRSCPLLGVGIEGNGFAEAEERMAKVVLQVPPATSRRPSAKSVPRAEDIDRYLRTREAVISEVPDNAAEFAPTLAGLLLDPAKKQTLSVCSRAACTARTWEFSGSSRQSAEVGGAIRSISKSSTR